MKTVGTYADAFIVSAAAVYLNVVNRLVSATGVTPIEPPGTDRRLTFTMGYLADKHFYAAIPIAGAVL